MIVTESYSIYSPPFYYRFILTQDQKILFTKSNGTLISEIQAGGKIADEPYKDSFYNTDYGVLWIDRIIPFSTIEEVYEIIAEVLL